MTFLELPPSTLSSPHAERAAIAMRACVSAGAGLMSLRGQPIVSRTAGDQLKTSVDRAAEGWVLGLLRATFPKDRFLAEESYEDDSSWAGGPSPYWTVDALDGTRSFVDGYDGFCVQVAFVIGGEPRLGVICEPVSRRVYLGIAGAGAWRIDETGAARLQATATESGWPQNPRFVDSTRPGGKESALFDRLGGRFIECGSVGLKICRVAEGSADVFMKRFRFKLWDVAPGEVILREAGGSLGNWEGKPFDYLASNVVQTSLLAAPRGTWKTFARALAVRQLTEEE